MSLIDQQLASRARLQLLEGDLDKLIALRARLQTVEDDLVAAGRRNVTVACTAGIFTWVRRGAGREPTEEVGSVGDIQEAEDMIVGQGRSPLVVMTKDGTFTWWPRKR